MTPRPRLGQINLVVGDMDATVAFYRTLGLEIDAEAGAAHVEVPLEPGVHLEFDTADSVALWDARWDGTTGGSAVIGIQLRSGAAVDEAVAALEAAGHQVHQAPYDAFWGARYAIVDDPDGYPVGLMGPIDEARRRWPPVPPPA
jgi:catechol 2,3-dioxygenase-like lactoylglutathione lyase family enzyme